MLRKTTFSDSVRNNDYTGEIRTCLMSDSTWSWGVVRVVAVLMLESITCVCTSRSSNRSSNFPIVEEIYEHIGVCVHVEEEEDGSRELETN